MLLTGQITKIISGGQTGADQAALGFAIKFHIPHGGWLPKGRRTENGALPERYQLLEMDTDSYAARTEKNIVESDGSVVVSHGELTGGSALTRELTEEHDKPCLHLDMNKMTVSSAGGLLKTWITDTGVKVLNVAGPRASEDAQMYDTVFTILKRVFSHG